MLKKIKLILTLMAVAAQSHCQNIGAYPAYTFTNIDKSYLALYDSTHTYNVASHTYKWSLAQLKTYLSSSGFVNGTTGNLTANAPAYFSATRQVIGGAVVLSLDTSTSITGLTTLYQNSLKANIASPTFTGTVTIPNGGILGTPTSITLSNATGLPQTGIATYTRYTFWANNTSSTATPTYDSLRHTGQQSLSSGALTWTAGVAPSSTFNGTYNWILIGNMVQFVFTLEYATAGTTITNLLIAWQSDMPNPVEPTGFTAASCALYHIKAAVANGSTNNPTGVNNAMIRRNSGDSAYEFNIPTASGTYKTAWVVGWYFIQ